MTRHKLRDPDEARTALATELQCTRAELDAAFADGGLRLDEASRLSEQVVGTFAVPLSLVAIAVDGRERIVPMATEEPSVVAAAQHGAKRLGDTVRAEALGQRMTAQVHLSVPAGAPTGLPDDEAARVVALADAAVPRLVERGGGVRALRTRTLAPDLRVVELDVDCGEAMGANLVDTIAEAVAPELAELFGGRVVMAILTNLCAGRRTRVTAAVPVAAVGGADVAGRIALASRIARLDVGRAVTSDKGVLNGVVAVALATGNDTRAVSAAAHGWAGRGAGYVPLTRWQVEDGSLRGELELPLSLGAVGGAGRVHRIARALLRDRSAEALQAEAAAVGLACNLSALRALVTEGIQRGHMDLHRR